MNISENLSDDRELFYWISLALIMGFEVITLVELKVIPSHGALIIWVLYVLGFLIAVRVR